jgi:hypothetical protein
MLISDLVFSAESEASIQLILSIRVYIQSAADGADGDDDHGDGDDAGDGNGYGTDSTD